ncbi:MAG: asparagine synthase-related protein [Brevinematales bacterium]|nr:asparagine synthase-related protein [Brevinematales bacterium]
MKRNIAFFLSTNSKISKDFLKAKTHLENLATTFGYKIYLLEKEQLNIIIVYEDEVKILKERNTLSFPIGNLGDVTLGYDRFLEICINLDESSISIRNDYAGSIPVFYSLRKHLSISNIEPCVVFDSGATFNDISYENLYGFLRYSHFIWDETAFSHIYTMLPDSVYNFHTKNLKLTQKYLKTVFSSEENSFLSDKEVAKKLYELNEFLVKRALSNFERIILPLSSGYDSRMIFSVLATDRNLKERLHCFTYGCEGSIEVEAARLLTKKFGIKWNFVDLPLEFLRKEYLLKIHNIFGTSLHMHGMYQLEFFEQIQKTVKLEKETCLTSGFMTGVPAGQHNSLLNITNENVSLTKAMNCFSQSNFWKDEELNCFPAFKRKNYIEKAEERFRLAFNRFEGAIYQKSVMFDVWTRQRNFISYYPRTLEWCIPTVSPHMTTEYANFFMSLSKRHLDNRFAVELMFYHYYPKIAGVPSNSNNFINKRKPWQKYIFSFSNILRKFGLTDILPSIYRNVSFDFDIVVLSKVGKEGIYPLLENQPFVQQIFGEIVGGISNIQRIYEKAVRGDSISYNKLSSIQSLAMSLSRLKEE